LVDAQLTRYDYFCSLETGKCLGERVRGTGGIPPRAEGPAGFQAQHYLIAAVREA
jgi:hypothetical protein